MVVAALVSPETTAGIFGWRVRAAAPYAARSFSSF
jgi:hypothetical protein